VAAVLVAVTTVGVFAALQGRTTIVHPPSSSPSPSEPPGSATPSSPVTLPPPTTATYQDGDFGSTLTHEPTAGRSQSRLWFNDGRWWATLVDPQSQELHIARLDWEKQQWVDTGTLVDERVHVRSDCLWDGKSLVIVSAGNKPSSSQAVRIIRFHYDKPTERYVVDPDFPITVTSGGVDNPVIGRDSAGALWMAYVDQGALIVRHTLGDDHRWSPRGTPKMDGSDGQTRAATLVADGKQVAIVWNRPNETLLRVGVHRDGTPADAWSAASTAVDGLSNSKGGFSVRSDPAAGGSRLFIAFETTYGTSTGNPLAPGAVLMIFGPDGSWNHVQLGRVEDHLAGLILAIDSKSRTIYAVASVASLGEITYKRSSLDRIAFEAGHGDALVGSPTNTSIRNPTTTKQDVDATNGFVVLGADDVTGRYLHGVLSTTAALSPRPSTSPPPAGPPPVANVLLHDTFDPWPVGTASPAEWVASSQGGGVGQLSVVAVPSATNHGLRVIVTSALGAVRACKSFPPAATGIVTVTELVRLSAIGGSDATLASVRGPTGEAVSVRVTRHGLLSYFNGLTKVVTTVTFRPGVWYRLTATVRLKTHTYDWTLATTSGTSVLRLSSIHWRVAAVPAIDSVCAQTPQSSRGVALFLDDVAVRR
jgi:hypothetical protein